LGQKGANHKPFFAEGVGAENGEWVAVIPADDGGHSFVGNGGCMVWHILFTPLLGDGLGYYSLFGVVKGDWGQERLRFSCPLSFIQKKFAC
jgi:hypothetical protein